MSSQTLGILGGGQLGRMSALAARQLGIKTVIYTPEDNAPASQVADETVQAAYDDAAALAAFADKVDVISYEFENIPVETVRILNAHKPVYPDERLLDITQDRRKEKAFLNEIGIETARWVEIENAGDITGALKEWGAQDAIIKTARFGYDGKGQKRIAEGDVPADILDAFQGQPLILEECIDFECEVSVIVARDVHGGMECYGPALNEHKNHILDTSTVPAPIDAGLAERAIMLTQKLAKEVELRGVLALEMFITKDGRILANEIAPRTHNSGHWSIDACAVSQFENHVRTVCGMPVLPPGQHSAAKMINLIGDDVNDVQQYEAQENAHLHLYGKEDIRPGRKMGHVTILGDTAG